MIEIILNTDIHTSKKKYQSGIIYEVDNSEYQILKDFLDEEKMIQNNLIMVK
jgi:hypothetical protein